MSDAISGQGTTFSKWKDSAWLPLSEILDITGPTMSRTTIDTTSLSSLGGYMTFMGGLRDPGTLSFAMVFEKSRYDELKDDYESDENGTYQIELPDDSTLEFEALVTEIPLNIPGNDKITVNVSFKISGSVVYTPGS